MNSEVVGGLPFNIYRSDCPNKKGGGVCVLANASFDVRVCKHTKTLKADVLSIEVLSLDSISHVQFILVYRPPNSLKCDDEGLIELLSDLASMNDHIVILGDFNLQIDWISFKTTNSASHHFLKFFSDSGSTQNVNLPTCAKNLLDIVLTTVPLTSAVKQLPPLASSDHAVLQFEIPLYTSTLLLPAPDFLAADFSSLNQYFSDVNWLNLFDQYTSCSDVYYM
ncbi:hypothetical protein Y032_0100g3317 [Ancylostoma ceylanicum]|uniref:Endonuclease/exonuclease/phosphatase domain-containing protein n=1 Tax=Ancylostoma ceylanicum TaxID=53326 RepID=A0A016TIF9_9BILA|nr:hypothetical protein Y032_0100g3317 [Ancylostoma ceylanicum]